MTPQLTTSQPPGLDLGDIYYILFRHKWKITLCSLAGILIAAYIYKQNVTQYQSEAKLLVRYIITEKNQSAPTDSNKTKIAPDERGQNIMNTEKEILESADLATLVAQAIGPDRILAKVGGGKDLGSATGMVRNGLDVSVGQSSSVIHILFRHPDPEIVQPVLNEVINRYQKLHTEAHKAAGMLGETLAQEADTLRSRLAQTEDELRQLNSKAGIVSQLEAAKENYGNQLGALQREIRQLEVELAGQLAVYEDIKKRVPANSAPAVQTEAEPEIPVEAIDKYTALTTRLGRLRTNEQELLLSYKADNIRVKTVQGQIIETMAEIKGLRDQYPGFTRISPPTETQRSIAPELKELADTWMRITSYQAKIKALTLQLEKVRTDSAKLEQMEGDILEKRRKKDLEESYYRYYATSLEQARINETLGTGKVSNISKIQAPSSPYPDRMSMKKVGLSIAGGICAGLAWAFLIELYLDRSVRRPVDLHRMLRVPLFLSIPRLKLSRHALTNGSTLALANGKADSQGKAGSNLFAESEAIRGNGSLRPFHETLRDRLIGYFENKNLTHKPKLVAVTGLRSKAGVTMTAAGLARSLSETGEGNVLLVDMTAEQGAAQEFAKGKAVCGIDELLETRAQAHVHENLYVVAESSNSERLSRNLPQRFARLIPKLKASDFDYIIFDMPMVNQLSVTPRLAGFMDMVLLVIESEKTDREVVQGACALLAESNAQVGVVLNKTRSYVPSRLQQQLMSS